MRIKPDGQWVALFSVTDEEGGLFYESGGVYSHRPCCKWTTAARQLTPGEHEAVCHRCGHRFAATDDGTAETHRDLHFDGDQDIPSICQ